MKVREFYEDWQDEEIEEWVEQYGVLVLFKTQVATREALLIIHGNVTESQKLSLLTEITMHFGGTSMTRSVCDKINEFAEKWYSKSVLKKKARVININTKRRG
jgi:hypothetical protein